MYICPSTSDLNIWVWLFLPRKAANRSSNIKQKKQHPHTHDTQMSPMVPWGSCVHELGKKKDSCEQLTCLGLGKRMIPGNRLGGFPPTVAAELLAQQKKYVDKWRDVCWRLHLQLRNYNSCKQSSCKFCDGGTVALIRGYVTQFTRFKRHHASTIFH